MATTARHARYRSIGTAKKHRARDSLAAVCFALAAGLTIAAMLLLTVRGHGIVPPWNRAPTGTIPLTITSTPPGATVLIDDQSRGVTPLRLLVVPGERRIVARLARYLDAPTTIVATDPGQALAIDLRLWLAAPRLQRLRAPLPGARLTGGEILVDGRVLVLMQVPATGERQLWYPGTSGDARRLGPEGVRGPIAPSADGAQVAWTTPLDGRAAAPGGQERFGEVWIGESGLDRPAEGPARRLWTVLDGTPGVGATNATTITGLAWTPESHHLIATIREQVGTGGRTRLLLLDTAGVGPPHELITLPGEPLADSWVWRADGQQAAFLATAGDRLALCLLGLDPEHPFFRYVDDVSLGLPTAIAPLAWSPPGDRIVYHAGMGEPGAQAVTLGVAPTTGGPAQLLPTGNGAFPTWSASGGAEGTLLSLYPRRDGYNLRLTDLAARFPSDGPALQLPPQTAVSGAHWDIGHGRALLTTRASSGGEAVDLWLVEWFASAR